MFETAVLSYGPLTKRVWATFAGFSGQAILIGCALLAPLLWPQVIPHVAWVVSLAPPGPPAPPPPPDPAVPHHARVVPFQGSRGYYQEPVNIPRHPMILVEDPEVAASGTGLGVIGGTYGGERDGVPFSIASQVAQIVPRPRPPEPPKTFVAPPTSAAPVDKPVRISVIQLAKPIYKVEPVYPPLARQARISGTVELVGVLGTDGRIHELRVVRGHPLLIDAAMSAVKQWVYAPTILNGQPVEVQAPILVNFILNR
ncbi:MAG TPA: energy transducer TonB [Candidatus Acidoferrales bacterium]|nr:energy transducer TonB [Candidatus Acidoferrales bacterium]